MNPFHPLAAAHPAIAARRQRGLSMIELLCGVSITATALGTAVPGLQDLKQRQALEATAAQLETDLHFARSEAIAHNRGVRLSVQALGGGSCYVIHTGAAHECRCSGDGQTQCEGSAEALRLVEQIGVDRARLASVGSSLLFDGNRGTVTPTATLKVVDSTGRAIHQVVNIMGRVRSCSPQAQVTGYKAC